MAPQGTQNKQVLADAFYDCKNRVTVNITMAPADWKLLLSDIPVGGGGAGSAHVVGPRYTWRFASIVEVITGSSTLSYSNVKIKKKSYWGSFSTTKPSLRLDFSASKPLNGVNPLEDEIGTSHLTLNNCIQDASYLRQPIGYALLRAVGCPSFRCNLASVTVNGNAFAGLYVNIEAFAKRFVKNFNNFFQVGDQGNGYEISAGDDITRDIITKPGYMTFEGFSKFSEKRDLLYAADTITNQGVSGMSQVVKMYDFEKFMAMETLMKQYDGYCNNFNNAFVYNDRVAVVQPGAGDVQLKFIISGIDQAFGSGGFQIFHQSRLAGLVFADSERKKELGQAFDDIGYEIQGANTTLWATHDALVATMTHFGYLTVEVENQISILMDNLPSQRNCQDIYQSLGGT